MVVARRPPSQTTGRLDGRFCDSTTKPMLTMIQAIVKPLATKNQSLIEVLWFFIVQVDIFRIEKYRLLSAHQFFSGSHPQ